MESEKELLLWAGTEESLREYVAALAAATQMAVNDPKAYSQAQQPTEQSPLLSVDNGIARVSIKGPLVNSDNPFLAFFGVVSYNEIRRAMIGAFNSGAKDIVLDIHSGGGHVAGVSDTARLIAQINSSIPVTTYTDGTMASAAYWLGCSAGRVYASDTSVVGSIGVLMVHIDQSEMLKEMKIKATVIRSGKYKALSNPYEPLSKTGKEELQAQVDAIDKVFVTHVADSRGVSYETAQAEMAQGREFVAAAAVTAGLIDGVSSYDAVIGGLAYKQKNLDKSKPLKNNKMNSQHGAHNMTVKTALTEADIAALAAGGSAEVSTPEQIAAASGEVPAVAAVAAAVAMPEVPAVPAAGAAPAAEAKTESELVTFLRAELKTAQDKLLEATIANRDLNAKVTSMDATHAALVVIAGDSANNMRVALGQAKVDLKTVSAEALVTQHKQLANDFAAKFKVGGVAATSGADAAVEPARKENSAMSQAKLGAVRMTNKQ